MSDWVHRAGDRGFRPGGQILRDTARGNQGLELHVQTCATAPSGSPAKRRNTMARITIDPVTRIEGHLRIDVEVDGGSVQKAWASCTMWRGIETILQGRDRPRRLGICAALLRSLHHGSRHGLGARRRRRAPARDSGERAVHPQPDSHRPRPARPHRALLSPVRAGLGGHHDHSQGGSRTRSFHCRRTAATGQEIHTANLQPSRTRSKA